MFYAFPLSEPVLPWYYAAARVNKFNGFGLFEFSKLFFEDGHDRLVF